MKAPLTAVLLGLAAASTASADERRFTYSYEAKTLPQGMWEFEQWATLRTEREEGDFTAVLFREEIEYGALDRLTGSLYLNWSWVDSRDVPGLPDGYNVEFKGVSSEWKYKLGDPVADPLGFLLYGEVAVGSDELELEGKLVFSKALGLLVLAYNFIYEIEWEETERVEGTTLTSHWEPFHAIQNTFGVSLELAPAFSLGLEAFHLAQFGSSLEEKEYSVFFAGPNLHVAASRGWATLTFLRQFDPFGELELERREKYEIRLIVGIHF
jgi:hypothetical protein